MFYENELRFLCDTFKKCRVQAVIESPDALSIPTGSGLDVILEGIPNTKPQTPAFNRLEDRTMYKYSNGLGCHYIYLKLPSVKAQVLVIGPYLSSPLSHRQIFELGEKLGAPPKSIKYLEEYYASIPVLADNSSLFVMLDTFCERIWQQPSFAIVDVDNEPTAPASPINEAAHVDNFDDVLVNMRNMEKRYSFENELMQAVSLGQMHKENVLLSNFSEQPFERRVADPVRNTKNYCIIMNTILRKAAENGGVHPVYLDRVSSEFAHKIEQLSSLSEAPDLMREMFRSYCRLVRKHSMKSYSRVVQKTVLLIDSDIAADLSLRSLAANQNISPGYLSTIFKKETGKTVSEYIREKRVKHAAHLLKTTHLQIQTVALHCGIMDVQYFSKIFKKQTGKTPKEYRETMK